MGVEYNSLEEYPEKAGKKAFEKAIKRMRDTCGISFELADTISRILMREFADILVQERILEIPHMGTFYYYKIRNKKGLSFRVNQEYKAIKNKGGTDENNFIRALEKSSNRSTRRSSGDIDDSE